MSLYEGHAIQVSVSDGIAELVFDDKAESVNKFDRATLEDLRAAVAAIEAADGIRGMVVSSGKPVFIVAGIQDGTVGTRGPCLLQAAAHPNRRRLTGPQL